MQNITGCMQVQIVPTADPVLPDSIATNFVMYRVYKITAFLAWRRTDSYTSLSVQRMYSALK
jgi:hypothetical protein